MQSCVGRTMAKTSSKENEMGAQGGPKTGVRVAAPGQRREESLKYSYGEVWGYLLLCTLILMIEAVANTEERSEDERKTAPDRSKGKSVGTLMTWLLTSSV